MGRPLGTSVLSEKRLGKWDFGTADRAGLGRKDCATPTRIVKALKKLESCGAELVFSREVGVEISAMKKATKAMMSVTKEREHLRGKGSLTRLRELEIDLLKQREKTLDRKSASTINNLAGVNVENASLLWSRVNIKGKIMALEPK